MSNSCPGADSSRAGLEDFCAGCPSQKDCASSSQISEEEQQTQQQNAKTLRSRLEEIEYTVLVMSGKGGVGKSTVAANLAWSLALRLPNEQISCLDIDLCGPSIPKMMGVEGMELRSTSSGWSPVPVSDNLQVVSMAFLLPKSDNPVIWRGPRKDGIISQFLRDVDWGKSKYLIIDTPPGTSDEHLTIAKWLRTCSIPYDHEKIENYENIPVNHENHLGVNKYGAILVSTPHQVSLNDVTRQITFCHKAGIPILGLLENMSGFKCPSCKGVSDVFSPSEDILKFCGKHGIRFLGSIPLDPVIAKCSDEGVGIVDQELQSTSSLSFEQIVHKVTALME